MRHGSLITCGTFVIDEVPVYECFVMIDTFLFVPAEDAGTFGCIRFPVVTFFRTSEASPTKLLPLALLAGAEFGLYAARGNQEGDRRSPQFLRRQKIRSRRWA